MLGVAVQLEVAPKGTGFGVQTSVPPTAGDATVVMANVLAANVTITMQLADTAVTVYVLPENVPPQLPATDAEYPVAGVTVNAGVAPDATVCTVAGAMVPLAAPFTPGVTVYVRGAAQLAVVPEPNPAHDQVNWLALEVTALAVPALHKFALGAVPVATALALPQTPLTGISVKLAVTVQSATTALVV